jgi:hypothetical protein
MARLPAPCWAVVMGKRSRVPAGRSFRELPGGTHCTLQDHPLARRQRGRVTARTAENGRDPAAR